ncbi:DUF4239 domain-containing protein [Nocardioides insulae]|uniref:bestrophin-like domain n=1 Tax=Nocardioides insulae TaxID=394734 RepID=UPI00041B5E29|nr:DUF4239 domain-containing protein [Nocardioides insulae]
MSDPWLNALLMLAAAALAFGASLAVRYALRDRRADTGSWSSTLSYVATAYGVVIGFSILFLFGEYADARQAVGDEATSVGTAYEQAALFPDSRDGMQRALICYARAVITYDWPAMREHRGAPEVDAAFRDLVVSVGPGDAPPVGALHSATATNLVSQIGSISTARETRLVAAETHVPPMLWALLLGGGAFVIAMIFAVTSTARRVTQAVLVAASVVFTVVMLLLVIALSAPFSGGSGRVTPRLIEETLTTMESAAPPATTAPCET